MKFYYTFGSSEQFPYQGGWVEVCAVNMSDAHAKFRQRFPDHNPGILNCSDYYTADQFRASGMQEMGNRGAFCHEVIQ